MTKKKTKRKKGFKRKVSGITTAVALLVAAVPACRTGAACHALSAGAGVVTTLATMEVQGDEIYIPPTTINLSSCPLEDLVYCVETIDHILVTSTEITIPGVRIVPCGTSEIEAESVP
jgi:hypothetical protein